ncbi:hypothetical protein Golomagni_08279 [Golovinomyces magnicellulatus]|nr:hypothetical protein Golomagni_08279 [Golovinomyces magnicellulatus]
MRSTHLRKPLPPPSRPGGHYQGPLRPLDVQGSSAALCLGHLAAYAAGVECRAQGRPGDRGELRGQVPRQPHHRHVYGAALRGGTVLEGQAARRLVRAPRYGRGDSAAVQDGRICAHQSARGGRHVDAQPESGGHRLLAVGQPESQRSGQLLERQQERAHEHEGGRAGVCRGHDERRGHRGGHEPRRAQAARQPGRKGRSYESGTLRQRGQCGYSQYQLHALEGDQGRRRRVHPRCRGQPPSCRRQLQGGPACRGHDRCLARPHQQ